MADETEDVTILLRTVKMKDALRMAMGSAVALLVACTCTSTVGKLQAAKNNSTRTAVSGGVGGLCTWSATPRSWIVDPMCVYSYKPSMGGQYWIGPALGDKNRSAVSHTKQY